MALDHIIARTTTPRTMTIDANPPSPSRTLRTDVFGFSLAGEALHACYAGERDARGRRHGEGRYRYPNRSFEYAGAYVRGLKEGHGEFNIGGCGTYAGQFEGDEMTGEGVRRYADGSVYSGAFVLGERHGQGRMVYAKKGEWYQGEWEDNRRHGAGTWNRADGSVFEGGFVHHKPQGLGTLTLPRPEDGDAGTDPVVVRGPFKADLKVYGKGSLELANGTMFEGDLVASLPQGQGVQMDATTGVTFEGTFESGQPAEKPDALTAAWIREPKGAEAETEEGASEENAADEADPLSEDAPPALTCSSEEAAGLTLKATFITRAPPLAPAAADDDTTGEAEAPPEDETAEGSEAPGPGAPIAPFTCESGRRLVLRCVREVGEGEETEADEAGGVSAEALTERGVATFSKEALALGSLAPGQYAIEIATDALPESPVKFALPIPEPPPPAA